MTTSIRVPDTISKLSPTDTYPVVQGADVGGFPELQAKVDSHDTKITANIDKIAALTRKGKTFLYVGKTPPVYDPEQHGNYVITIQDGFLGGTMTINPPTPTGGMVDGALFTIYNEDDANIVLFTPGSTGATINGTSGVTILQENFATFVYDLAANDYVMIENGYIPASKLNLMNYMFHRYSAYLHTFNDLRNEGFIEGVKVSGQVAGSTTLDETVELNFVNGKVEPVAPGKVNITIDQPVVAPAINVNTANGGIYNGVETITFTDMNGTVNGPVVSLTSAKQEGVNVTNGTTTIPNAKTANFPNARVSAGSFGAADVVPYVKVAPDGTSTGSVGNIDELRYAYPLTMSVASGDHIGHLSILPDAYAASSGPSLLAYLNEPQEVPPLVTYHDPNGWPQVVLALNDVVYQDSTKALYDRDTLKIDLKFDPKLADPDGSMTFMIAARAAIRGVAPNYSGMSLFLYDVEKQEPATDISGRPIVFFKACNTGEKFGTIDLHGILKITSDAHFYLAFEHKFANPLTLEDRYVGPSGVVVQHLTGKAKTGPALLQYQMDSGDTIRFVTKFFGQKFLNFNEALRPWGKTTTQQFVAVPDGTYVDFNGNWRLRALSNVTYGIVPNGEGMIIKNTNIGVNAFDYYLGKIISPEHTRMLSGYFIEVDWGGVSVTQNHKVSILQWNGGTNDVYPTEPIMTGRVSGTDTPIWNTGWTEISSFVIQDNANGVINHQFQMPANIGAAAVVMYPQSPNTAAHEMEFNYLDARTGPFTAYLMYPPVKGEAQQAHWKDFNGELTMDNQGAQLIRYTFESTPQPLPVGEITYGSDVMAIDDTTNMPIWTGPKGQGAIIFKVNGDVKLRTTVNLYCANPDPTFVADVDIWYSTVTGTGPGAVLNEVPGSRTTCTVRGGLGGQTPQRFTLNTASFHVNQNDEVALSGECVASPGVVFMQSYGGATVIPMLHTLVEYITVAQ
ncbi:hypothetical protein [Aeromonas phage 1233]|nr:hypothetical protein [Aeromonas phage 1233]